MKQDDPVVVIRDTRCDHDAHCDHDGYVAAGEVGRIMAWRGLQHAVVRTNDDVVVVPTEVLRRRSNERPR